MHPDLVDLLKYAGQKGLFTRFDTNGLKLADPSYVEQLKDVGISYILVSLDSADPKRHDEFRRVDGAWSKAVQAIKNCTANGIPVGISTVATPYSTKSGDLKNLIHLGGCPRIDF